MEKLFYDQNQKSYLINGVQLQIEALKKQLGELYSILAQLDSSLVDENILPINTVIATEKSRTAKRVYAPRGPKEGDKDYFAKVKQVLELEGQALTSRDILTRIYEYYPNDFDENEDRKNIASLSAILTEKTSEGKILRDKPDVGHAVFYLPSNKNNNETIKEIEITIPGDDDDPFGFFEETKKVDPNDDDLPF